MTPIEAAKAHFRASEVRRIEIPEWGPEPDVPLIAYFKPVTLAQKQDFQTVAEQLGYINRLAYIVVRKLEDAEGKRLFDLAHARTLREEADPDVIARVVQQIMAAPGPEELEKK